MLLCKHCNKNCKNNNSLVQHERLCNNNPNKQEHPRGNLGKRGWNKGLTVETDERVRNNGIAIKNSFKENGHNWTGKKHSEKTKDLLSEIACKRIAKHSKYSKNIEYNGVILESSFELRLAEILDKLSIKWMKVRVGYKWDDDGKIRRYVPDFYLPDYDLFLDPKNDYLIDKDKIKIKSAMEMNNIKVIVLSEKELELDIIRDMLL